MKKTLEQKQINKYYGNSNPKFQANESNGRTKLIHKSYIDCTWFFEANEIIYQLAHGVLLAALLAFHISYTQHSTVFIFNFYFIYNIVYEYMYRQKRYDMILLYFLSTVILFLSNMSFISLLFEMAQQMSVDNIRILILMPNTQKTYKIRQTKKMNKIMSVSNPEAPIWIFE